MSGDPLELSESDAQTAAEQDAEEADYRRYRAELLRKAAAMRPDQVAALIERAGLVAAERDSHRAALERIARGVGNPWSIAREALEPPF